ncbi:MAG: hypothetical protein HDS20_04730 [Bacteroides sp.]|nr:hypothetical protein [Bacteroides sp.]
MAAKACNKSQAFLSQYNPTNYNRILYEICAGLNMYNGSPSSFYLTFIPHNSNEVIKLRISDHPSSEREWGEHELTGYPNRRYSIIIFSNKSMPSESNQGLKELSWKSYMANNIPVYEKGYNQAYLKETYNSFKEIITMIFDGANPEDKTLRINLDENYNIMYSTDNAINQGTIIITESDICEIVENAFLEVLGHNPSVVNYEAIEN